MSQPSGFQKVSLVAKHMVKHKQILMCEDIEATEGDQNYTEASELFLVFSAQMEAVITQTEIFQTRMLEALSASTEQADAFVRMSQGGGERGGGQDGDWLLASRARTSLLHSVVKESTGMVKQIMDKNLNEQLLVTLKRELDSYSETPKLMYERLKTRMGVQHYTQKIKELDNNPKALPEKIERNKEKYAQVIQALYSQTNQLMDIFSKAERLRQQLLCDDLNTIIALQQRVFDSISNTIRLTPEKRGSSLDTASCTDTLRTVPSICTLSIGSPLSLRSLSPSPTVQERNFHSFRSPTHSQRSFSDVPLDGTLTIEGANMQNDSAVGSPQRMAFDGKQQVILSSHHSFTCSRHHDDPKGDDSKGSQSSMSYNNTCTSIGTVSSPNAKMMAKERVEAQGSLLTSAVNAAASRGSPSTDHCSSEKLLNDDSSITASKEKGVPGDRKSTRASKNESSHLNSTVDTISMDLSTSELSEKGVSIDSKLPLASKNESSPLNSAVGTISMDSSSIDLSEKGVSSDTKSPHTPNDSQNSSREAETSPGMVKVRALFDYEGTEKRDISFMADDTIITSSIDWAGGGWVEGTNGSQTGMFPSNYCVLIQ